jgi:hypothetical protein
MNHKKREQIMRIAVIGWGSLIWNPRDLQIRGGWNNDGPLLPIEFARISGDGRLALVLYPGVDSVRTLWAYSAYEDLGLAKENLRKREATIMKRIGYVSIANNQSSCQTVPEICDVIHQWAEEKGLEAVIWTDLSSNFESKTGMPFSDDNTIAYLRSLMCESLEKAEEYVRKAPRQIRTTIRERIERELGWIQT